MTTSIRIIIYCTFHNTSTNPSTMLGFKAKLIFITRCSSHNMVKKHKFKHFSYSIRHHNGCIIVNVRQVSPLFLANVNSRSRSLYAIARPSVVCLSVSNVRAPYSGGSDFRQYFYGIRYLGHPWTSTENFTEIVPGEPLRRGS